MSQNTGRYLYAIVASAEDRSCGSIGIDGGLVYSISDGRVAAVVSDVPDQKIRPERRNLAAHQEVLKRLMQESSPLP
ncbi:MAG: GvpL/GvpF family gas vesicle protein, partial [Acidobacteriota bacterium]